MMSLYCYLFMGNISELPGFDSDDYWKVVAETKYGHVVRSPSGEEAELYKIRVPPQNYQKMIEIYQKRKNRPGSMVRVLEYYEDRAFTCDSVSHLVVLTERVTRLDEMQEVNPQQAIDIIKQVLILYQSLQPVFGPFALRSGLIGRSEQGYTKLWVNENLGKNWADDQYQNQRQPGIARRVCELVSRKVSSGGGEIKTLFDSKKYAGYPISRIVEELSNMQLQGKADLKCQTKSEVSSFTFNPRTYNDESLERRNNPYLGRYTEDLFKYVKTRPTSTASNTSFSLDFPLYIHSAPTTNNPVYSPTAWIPPITREPPQLTLGSLRTPTIYQQISYLKLPKYYQTPDFQSYIPRLPNPPSNLDYLLSEAASIQMSSTLKNPPFLQFQPSKIAPSDTTVKPSRKIRSHSGEKEIDDMKIVRSHVFVTNEDLYSDIDNMLRGDNIKLQQSRVVRRLSEQRSEAQ